MHFQVRIQKRPEQPGPDRAVVIGRIAIALRAAIAAVIFGIARGQRPQPDGREQFAPDGFDDGLLLLRRSAGCWAGSRRKSGWAASTHPAETRPPRPPSPRNGLSQNALRNLSATLSARRFRRAAAARDTIGR